MNHLDFIVWMIAFPVLEVIIDAIRWNYCERREYSDETKAISALFRLVIWLVVAKALW